MEGVQAFVWILDAAKSAAREALAEVFGTYTESDYTTDDWMVLVGFKEAGDKGIDAATDLAEVEVAQSAAVMEMEGVKTIARILEAAKSTSHGALESAFKTYTESDYIADDWMVLVGFKEAGDTAIDAALDLAEVEAARLAAVTGMEGVETIAKILEAAKSAAHETLAASFEADTGSNDTVGDDTESIDTVGDDTEGNDAVDDDTESNAIVDDATESNDAVDNDTESNDTVGDDTESNDTVDDDSQSSDTIDDGSILTDLITTGDTEMDAVTEIEQIVEPPATDAPDVTRQKRSRPN